MIAGAVSVDTPAVDGSESCMYDFVLFLILRALGGPRSPGAGTLWSVNLRVLDSNSAVRQPPKEAEARAARWEFTERELAPPESRRV